MAADAASGGGPKKRPSEQPGADQIWAEIVNRTPGPVRRPALFLDRDGVVVEEVPYLHRVEDARLVDGAVAAIRAANARVLPVVMVTNQGGIGLGRYDWPAFAGLQDWIWEQLAARDAFVNAVMACPFHPDGQGDLRHADHPDRKPNPGMLRRAAELLPIDLGQSWIVGDRAIDLAAGRAAGLAGGVLVASEHTHAAADAEAVHDLADGPFQVVTCDNRDHVLGALSPLFSHA